MSVAGAAIGLTRGTGLTGRADSSSFLRAPLLSAMRQAEMVFSLTALLHPISQAEMVFSLTALLHPLMVRRCLR